jgi:hypothetical protein
MQEIEAVLGVGSSDEHKGDGFVVLNIQKLASASWFTTCVLRGDVMESRW